MSKLTDIIRREVKDLVSKQGGLMVTPAVITAVQEDYLRADVKLLGNGAEIKGMLNKSPGKLTVGQTVTVAYETLPSSGVILIANGETDPLSEGGGWEVDTAVLLDSANIHDWVAEEELITDISTNTKLLYGGNQRFVSVQGYPCQFGSNLVNPLTVADASKFGNKIEVDAWFRPSASDDYALWHIVAELLINTISTTTSSGQTVNQYTFVLCMTGYPPQSSVASWCEYYPSSAIVDPLDAFLVPQVQSMSFLTEFEKRWGNYTKTASTPYGYVQSNQMPICLGIISQADPTALTLYSSWDGTTVYITTSGSNQQYRCVPIENNAEKCFDMSLITRSEPTGGGTNAGT